MPKLKNIVLVGFMGAGKSLVASLLAKRLQREVVSTDDLIVKKEGRPITDIFSDSGEPYFRSVEKDVVAQIADRQNLIIDCGGGVVVTPENLENLKRTGTVFYLKTSPWQVYERIKDQTHRPLVNVPNPQERIAELLATREAFYSQADYTLTTDGKTGEQNCREIEDILSRVQ